MRPVGVAAQAKTGHAVEDPQVPPRGVVDRAAGTWAMVAVLAAAEPSMAGPDQTC